LRQEGIAEEGAAIAGAAAGRRRGAAIVHKRHAESIPAPGVGRASPWLVIAVRRGTAIDNGKADRIAPAPYLEIVIERK
jgi:hypothetical protein